MRTATSEDRSDQAGQLSPYDPLVKKYATMYELDWRLVTPQTYQEPRFDPVARSWAGALGLSDRAALIDTRRGPEATGQRNLTMFPYRDENETVRTPFATYALIGLNVGTWLFVQGAGSTLPLMKSVCELGLIPGELTLSVPPGTRFPMGEGLACLTDPGRQTSHIFTSMFLHGSWMHMLGNMWFLWIFGNNVEDAMGRIRFLIFYLLTGVAAALTQVLLTPASAVPMVGASGAISGVMGGYILLYPHVRVFVMVPLGFFLTSMAWPAWMMLGYWLLLQFVSGLTVLGREGGGVAFWAHFGGFVGGVVLVKLFARPAYIAQHQARHWRPRHVGLHSRDR